MIPGLRALIDQLPGAAAPFANTQFPFPVSQALFGATPDLARIREQAEELDSTEAKPQDAAWVALCAAEAIESVQPDRDKYFSSDGSFRGAVFGGIKWRAGWALIMGDGQEPYSSAFDAASFMVYTTRPDSGPGKFLGERETASVYFAQLLARYALLYSDVSAGDRHDLTHFVEDHGPGVLIVSGAMKLVESLLCLSLMRLGMRAAVVPGFPWEVGDRVEVSSPEEAVAAVASFENLRIRAQDPLAALPEYANPAHAHEKFEPAARLGGGNCFLVLRRGTAAEGITAAGQPGPDLGIIITIDDSTLDAIAEDELEGAAAGYLNMLDGVKVQSHRPLALALRGDVPPADHMAEVIRRGLRLEFPRLGPISVEVIGDAARLAAMAPGIAAERARRDAEVARLSAMPPDVVYTCEACAPFSREHVCITHPVRTPMCGRNWKEMLVGARYMGVSSGRPWRRRGRPENCCAVVPLGRAIDPVKGEYEGLNESVRQATGGRIQRVFLHSVRDFPHSSCGCFYALAWWSDAMDGIGLMHRGFEGAAPDGAAWNELANRAGGKQAPGITGVGVEYMRSPTFLQGDGGWKSVKWMTSKLRDEVREAAPKAAAVPTEKG
jgi:acetyl-CoA decarbonylase/synthase complex subunit beta